MHVYNFNQRVEKLFKSYFSSYTNIRIKLNDSEICIYLIDERNLDSACLELKKFSNYHQITFWDGYSQCEVVKVFNEKDSAKALKRFMKKLKKILDR